VCPSASAGEVRVAPAFVMKHHAAGPWATWGVVSTLADGSFRISCGHTNHGRNLKDGICRQRVACGGTLWPFHPTDHTGEA
jgi:hypothetical protein